MDENKDNNRRQAMAVANMTLSELEELKIYSQIKFNWSLFNMVVSYFHNEKHKYTIFPYPMYTLHVSDQTYMDIDFISEYMHGVGILYYHWLLPAQGGVQDQKIIQ